MIFANPVVIYNESLPINQRHIIVASNRNEIQMYAGINVTYVDWTNASPSPYRRVCTDVGGPLLEGSEMEMQLWGSASPELYNTCGDYPMYSLNETLLDEYCSIEGTIVCRQWPDFSDQLLFVSIDEFLDNFYLNGQAEWNPNLVNYSRAELCTRNGGINSCKQYELGSTNYAFVVNVTDVLSESRILQYRTLTFYDVTVSGVSDSSMTGILNFQLWNLESRTLIQFRSSDAASNPAEVPLNYSTFGAAACAQSSQTVLLSSDSTATSTTTVTFRTSITQTQTSTLTDTSQTSVTQTQTSTLTDTSQTSVTQTQTSTLTDTSQTSMTQTQTSTLETPSTSSVTSTATTSANIVTFVPPSSTSTTNTITTTTRVSTDTSTTTIGYIDPDYALASELLVNAASVFTPNFRVTGKASMQPYDQQWIETNWVPLSQRCLEYECTCTEGLTSVCSEDFECATIPNPVMIWNESLTVYPRIAVVSANFSQIILMENGITVKYVEWTGNADPLRRVCTDTGGEQLAGSDMEMELWRTAAPNMVNTCGDFPQQPVNTSLVKEYCKLPGIECTIPLFFVSKIVAIIRNLYLLPGATEGAVYDNATLCTFQQPSVVCMDVTSSDYAVIKNSTRVNGKALPVHTRVLTLSGFNMSISDANKTYLQTTDLYGFVETDGVVVRIRFEGMEVPESDTSLPTRYDMEICDPPTPAPTRAPTLMPTFVPTGQPSREKLAELDRAAFISIPMIVFVVALGVVAGVILYKSKHDKYDMYTKVDE